MKVIRSIATIILLSGMMITCNYYTNKKITKTI